MIDGNTLRGMGLTPRMLAAYAGSERLPLVAARARTMAPPASYPNAALFALFVIGVDVPRMLVPELDESLVELRGRMVRARVAILPVGRTSLIVCDRLDAEPHVELVCWPDDSSYHLAAALPPGRRARWLDLGTGSAFAPLLRPELAHEIVGAELNPRAAMFATFGVELSKVTHVTIRQADLAGDLAGPFELVSCNAPIPSAAAAPVWQATTADFVPRLFGAASRVVAPAGLVVVHAALDALEPVVRDLGGERVVVAYTPTDAARGFAVAWWSPGGEDRLVLARRALAADHPHLTHDDRDAALAGTLAPL